jgi:hypothetical protein
VGASTKRAGREDRPSPTRRALASASTLPASGRGKRTRCQTESIKKHPALGGGSRRHDRRRHGKETAKELQPEIPGANASPVTHVLGTFCYLCVRAGQSQGWRSRRDSLPISAEPVEKPALRRARLKFCDRPRVTFSPTKPGGNSSSLSRA